jgi:hypothetical protein
LGRNHRRSSAVGLSKEFNSGDLRLDVDDVPLTECQSVVPAIRVTIPAFIKQIDLVSLTKIRHLAWRPAHRVFTLLPIFTAGRVVRTGRNSPSSVGEEADWAGSVGWTIRIDTVVGYYTIGGSGNIGNL